MPETSLYFSFHVRTDEIESVPTGFLHPTKSREIALVRFNHSYRFFSFLDEMIMKSTSDACESSAVDLRLDSKLSNFKKRERWFAFE